MSSRSQGIAMHETCIAICGQNILVLPANNKQSGAKPSTQVKGTDSKTTDHASEVSGGSKPSRNQSMILQGKAKQGKTRQEKANAMQNPELCKNLCVHAIKTLEVIRTRKGLGQVIQTSTPSILTPKSKDLHPPFWLQSPRIKRALQTNEAG